MGEGQITTLIENVVYQASLVAEHGFSALIEWKGQRILFDFGQSDQFLRNAVLLGIDPRQIDVAVVSHGHYDHTGGIYEFLSTNTRAEVWMRETAFDPKATTAEKPVGIPSPNRLDRSRFRHPDGLAEIAPGLFLLPPPPLVHPEDFHGDGLLVRREDSWVADDFRDEQSLVLVDDQSVTLISACSHRGIGNIVQATHEAFGLPIKLVVGGFHLKGATPEQVGNTIQRLNRYPIRQYGICHCTGVEHLGQLKTELNASVFYNHTGRIIHL